MKTLLIGQGYVGSYLTEQLRGFGHNISVCSTTFGVSKAIEDKWREERYQNLRPDYLASFDCILWFAGHSSVGKAIRDPSGAIQNNCFDLLDLARQKPSHIPMVYASTASLYSVNHDASSKIIPPPSREPDALISSLNAYDSSKAAFDALVGPLAQNTCGLRLGTVCGFSPKLRRELVFNSMNLSAKNEGVVRVSNRHAWRSILFLDDLSRVVDGLLNATAALPRFINVASVDIQIGNLAEQVAKSYDVNIELLPDSATYSFRMTTDLMSQTIGALPRRSIEERCDDFRTAMKESK